MPTQLNGRIAAAPPGHDDDSVIAAMTALGATVPAHACRHHALPPAIRDRLPLLLDRGIVREGRPGYFYLYLPQGSTSPRQPMTVQRGLFAIAFWLVIILIPVVFMYLAEP